MSRRVWLSLDPAHPRAVPMELPCPSFPALPVAICLESCLDGTEQQITPEPWCEDLVLIHLCTSWLACFAQPPKGILVNLK